MWLFDRFARRLLRKGELTVIDADGSRRTYGAPDPGAAAVLDPLHRCQGGGPSRPPPPARRGRAVDGRAAGDRAGRHRRADRPDPLQRPVGEAAAAASAQANPLKRHVGNFRARLDKLNWEAKSKRNVAHHYDLGDRLYDLFLDADRQYSCAYFTDPANSLEQAQTDKKAHIAAKLALKPGQRVLDIGCGWGGMALYLNRVADVDVLGITLSEEQLKTARRARRGGGRRRPRQVRADRLSQGGGRVRPDRLGRHVRACRPAALPHLLPQVPLAAGRGRRDAAPHDRPDGRAGHDRRLHRAIHLPRRLQSGAVRDRRGEREREADRLRHRDAAAALRLHAAAIGTIARVRARRTRSSRCTTSASTGCGPSTSPARWRAFRHGGMCNYQIQYIRSRDTLPITRDYLAEAEAALRAKG